MDWITAFGTALPQIHAHLDAMAQRRFAVQQEHFRGERETVTRLLQAGSPEQRAWASGWLSKMMDPGYKAGTAMKELQGLMAGPAVASPEMASAAGPGAGPTAAQAPQGGMMPAGTAGAPAPQPGGVGQQAQAPAAPAGPPPGGVSTGPQDSGQVPGGPPKLALPSTSPTQAGAPPTSAASVMPAAMAAGGPPAPPAGPAGMPQAPKPPAAPAAAAGAPPGPPGPPPGVDPEVYSDVRAVPQMLEAAGAGGRPQPPDPMAIRAGIAKWYGASPEQLESEDYLYPKGRFAGADPVRAERQQQYRQTVEKERSSQEGTYRNAVDQYEASIRSMVGQLMTTHRTGKAAEAAAGRAAAAEEGRDRRFEERRGAEGEARADRALRKELERIEKARNPKGFAEQALHRKQLQQDPGFYDRQREKAFDDYEVETGKPHKLRGNKPDAAAPPPPPPGAAPVASTPAKVSAAPTPTPKPATRAGGPPPPPVTDEDHRRAAQIVQAARTGVLSLEDKRWLADYKVRRARGMQGTPARG